MTHRIYAMRPEMQCLRAEGKTLREIASILKINEKTVGRNLKKAHAPRTNLKKAHAPRTNQFRGWSEEEDVILIQGRKDGLTGQALTALLPDRVHGTVLNRLHTLRARGIVR